MYDLMSVALQEKEPDFVLKGGLVLNVFSGALMMADIAVYQGKIAGLGQYNCKNSIDIAGKIVLPGLIDGHIHIESTMLTPKEFGKIALENGVTTAICDPHEIANVLGVRGVENMIEWAKETPFDALFMAPSCVPATDFENNGATICAEDIENLLNQCYGLGEMMNAPGVFLKDEQVGQKINCALQKNMVVDGHLSTQDIDSINAYLARGIITDHESVSQQEALKKLERGMYVLIREGSAGKNCCEILKGVTKANLRRFLFCTDDKHIGNIIDNGLINNNIKLAIAQNIDPIDAVTIATLNASECYNLNERGAIAPGRIADIVVVDNLINFNIEKVFKNGKQVVEKGKYIASESSKIIETTNTVNCKKISENNLELVLKSNKVKIIGLEKGTIYSKSLIGNVAVENGKFAYSDNGVLKACVVERHHNTGNIGLGLVAGLNIKNGAVATTISHDNHNIIACGSNDCDIALAVNTLIDCGGGEVVTNNGKVIALLKLPVAGLMSDKDARSVAKELGNIKHSLATELGADKDDEIFMALSFLSLIVVPSLKLTDKGLFDNESFSFTSNEVD